MTSTFLAKALGLRPLDRVQVANRREVAEMAVFGRMTGVPQELPYLFFQRVNEKGLLEVRSPSGYVTAVDALDVCDVIQAEPIRVNAMPRSVFLARLSLPLAQRQTPAPAECFHKAMVRYVIKDRWNKVDQVFVTFDDESLNTGADKFATPIASDDLARINQTATRLTMPVMGPGHGNASADAGLSREQALQQATASAFIHCALAGHAQGVDRIGYVGVQPLKLADVRKLRLQAMGRQAQA